MRRPDVRLWSRRMTHSITAVVRACGITFGRLIEPKELPLLLACGLVAYGFWDLWRPGTFFAPGVVLLWLHLPVREAFIRRPPASTTRRPD